MAEVTKEVDDWQLKEKEKCQLNWHFTNKAARVKREKHDPSNND